MSAEREGEGGEERRDIVVPVLHTHTHTRAPNEQTLKERLRARK